MQDKKMWGFDFVTRFLVIFSISIIFVAVMGVLAGDSSKEYSTMYMLGSQGLAFETMAQLGLVALIVSILSGIFFSERLFKNMMFLWRVVLMLFSIIVVIVLCIIAFGWFPIGFLPGWIGFFVSFGICFAGSTIISVIKTKSDSKKYEELLEHYKRHQGEE